MCASDLQTKDDHKHMVNDSSQMEKQSWLYFMETFTCWRCICCYLSWHVCRAWQTWEEWNPNQTTELSNFEAGSWDGKELPDPLKHCPAEQGDFERPTSQDCTVGWSTNKPRFAWGLWGDRAKKARHRGVREPREWSSDRQTSLGGCSRPNRPY